MSIAERILQFNEGLSFTGRLPDGVQVMNPFANSDVRNLTRLFYSKYYNDDKPRYLILGINPGRFGAGATGIPFTDTVRLNLYCDIHFEKFRTFEPSSAFIYEMISEFGGTAEFYERFLFSAICPLGFTIINDKGRQVNYNYYGNADLLRSVYPFILDTLNRQLEFGISRDICFCLGTGKNDAFLRKLNAEFLFFREIITLEHPRYIMQYRSRYKKEYIKKYVDSFTRIGHGNP